MTQLRLATEKTNSLLVKCKISALIALCYKILDEPILANKFKDDAISQYSKYTNEYLRRINYQMNMTLLRFLPNMRFGGGMAVSFARDEYNTLIDDMRDFGIEVKESKIAFSEAMVKCVKNPFISENAESMAKRVVASSQLQFKSSIEEMIN